MDCRVCGNQMELIDVLKNHESEITSIYDLPYISKPVDISFYRCPSCSHGQIDCIYDRKYYESYKLLHNANESAEIKPYPSMLMKHYKKKFAQLAQLSKVNNRVLDIGCGPGVLLYQLLDFFRFGVGIEPSKFQVNHSVKDERINIIQSFFDKQVHLADESFDAIICTQVLEHLNCLSELVKTAYEKLAVGGVAYFEVPNGGQIFDEAQYYNIYSEHVNYFTLLSLSSLLRKCGFYIIEIGETFASSLLYAYVKKIHHKKEIFSNMEEKHRKLILDLKEKYSHIGIWGCGNKAKSFITLLTGIKLECVIDSNDQLRGGYLPRSGVRISLPEKKQINSCDLILVFAVTYKKEIKDSLIYDFHYKGNIIFADEL